MSEDSKQQIWRFLNWAFLSVIGYLTYATNPALGTMAMVFATGRYFSQRNDV